MKKKIIALCLTVCLAAVAVVGGTLAYFTDTDEATNVFTTGKVDIALEENFDEDNAKLLPGIENAVTKEVSIKVETGSEDAYVWYEWLIPAVLDSADGSTGTNNIVHVNSYGRTWDTYRENSKYWDEGQTEALPLDQTWDHDADIELEGLEGPQGFIGTEEIDGITYNKYVVLYRGKLAAGEETTLGMKQVYMDKNVDTNNQGKYIDKNGNEIRYDFTEGINIIVRAYGIQAEGFADVYEAYTAYNAD